jgi:hypothetical protein
MEFIDLQTLAGPGEGVVGELGAPVSSGLSLLWPLSLKPSKAQLFKVTGVRTGQHRTEAMGEGWGEEDRPLNSFLL